MQVPLILIAKPDLIALQKFKVLKLSAAQFAARRPAGMAACDGIPFSTLDSSGKR